jgi:pyruvate-ferredoxin/flavodoxin oxidoreductase
MDQQKLAVQTGHWPLYRYNPENVKEGKNPLKLDSKAPSKPIEEYMYNETRYKMLTKFKPEIAKKLLKEAQKAAEDRWHMYENLANIEFNGKKS